MRLALQFLHVEVLTSPILQQLVQQKGIQGMQVFYQEGSLLWHINYLKFILLTEVLQHVLLSSPQVVKRYGHAGVIRGIVIRQQV